jgi:hypothetical protein
VVIRVVNTASGSKAVQVVYYRNRKRVVYKHVGSGRTDEEVSALRKVAQEVIDGLMPQLPFPGEAGRKTSWSWTAANTSVSITAIFMR